MSAQPEMNKKLLARMRKGAEPMLEPGETVLYGVANLTLPAWAYMGFAGLLVLPYVMQKSSMAVVTERNVYVLKTPWSFKARRVLLKAPLGSVESVVAGKPFPGRYLRIGDQKIWLPVARKVQDRARAIAAAASGKPVAIDEPASAAAASAAGRQEAESSSAQGEEGGRQPPA